MGHEAPAELAPGLFGVQVDVEHAIEQYLTGQLKVRPLVELLTRSRAFHTFAAAAPGLPELVTVGVVWTYAVALHEDRRPVWDYLVVDCPATGHGIALLETAGNVEAIAGSGPIRDQAARIQEVVTHPAATGVAIVARPEELAVSEAVEAAAVLRERGMPVAAAVLNGVRAPRFRPEEESALAAVATADGPDVATASRRGAGLRHLAEQRSDDGYRRRLADGTACRSWSCRSWSAGASTCLPWRTSPRPWRRRLAERPPVIEAVGGRQLVVCCGAGGVGKTTVSAGLSLGLALGGARTAVVTIDPARRLATALGLEGLSDEPHRVPRRAWRTAASSGRCSSTPRRRSTDWWPARRRVPRRGAHPRQPHLQATSREPWPAPRTTWPSSACTSWSTRAPTTSSSSTRPPSQNALDFLDAPARITRFIEGRALRLLLRPPVPGANFGRRMIAAGTSTIFSVLERLTGAQLMRDLSDFLAAFDGMYDGLRGAREGRPGAAEVALRRLRRGRRPAGRGPRAGGGAGAPAVGGRLSAGRRRAQPRPPAAARGARPAGGARPGAGRRGRRRARLARGAGGRHARGAADPGPPRPRRQEALSGAFNGTPVTEVPAFEREPVELEGLVEVAAALWPAAPAQPAASSPS